MNNKARSIAALLAATAMSGRIALAQEDYQILKAFGENGANRPSTGLIRADDGNFYGSSTRGVYRLTPDGAFTLIGPLDKPILRSLVQATDGYLYGTTDTAILRMSLNGETSVLHTYGPLAQEGRLVTPLVNGDDGLLYGLQTVPSHNTSRLVSMTLSGELTTSPSASELEGTGHLVKGRDGFFYVNLPVGGLGSGSIVRVSRDGMATTLHVFGDDGGGSYPIGGVVHAADGNLYGTTARNGAHGFGTIFRLQLDGQFTVLHSFDWAADGISEPQAPLLEGTDANLYGSGEYGIFRVTRDGAFKLLHTTTHSYPGWAANDRYGAFPVEGLVEGPGGDLYGAQHRSAPGEGGALFRLKHIRSACADDVHPLWQDYNGGTLYLLGALKNETKALWGAWLVTGQGIKRLWLTVVPPVTPTFVFELSMPQAPVGKIGVFTVVLTSDGHACSDWSTTDTSGPGPADDDLKQMLNHSGVLPGTGIVNR